MKTVYEVQPPVNGDKNTDTASQKYFIEILQLCFFIVSSQPTKRHHNRMLSCPCQKGKDDGVCCLIREK